MESTPWHFMIFVWKILTFPFSKAAVQELFFHFKFQMPRGFKAIHGTMGSHGSSKSIHRIYIHNVFHSCVHCTYKHASCNRDILCFHFISLPNHLKNRVGSFPSVSLQSHGLMLAPVGINIVKVRPLRSVTETDVVSASMAPKWRFSENQ